MAVEVHRNYTAPSKVTHDEGETIDVQEGHLHVRRGATTSGRGKAIAVYAPGSWHDARVVPATSDSR